MVNALLVRKSEMVWYESFPWLWHDGFFVQQTTEPKYPEVLLIGLNKNGVLLIDPATKVGLS